MVYHQPKIFRHVKNGLHCDTYPRLPLQQKWFTTRTKILPPWLDFFSVKMKIVYGVIKMFPSWQKKFNVLQKIFPPTQKGFLVFTRKYFRCYENILQHKENIFALTKILLPFDKKNQQKWFTVRHIFPPWKNLQYKIFPYFSHDDDFFVAMKFFYGTSKIFPTRRISWYGAA